MKPLLLTVLVVLGLSAAACQPPSAVTAEPGNPQPLGLQWPAPGEAVDASPILQWDGFPGATHYQVTVADSGSNEVLLQQDTTETLLPVAPALPKGATYVWNAQAQDDTHTVLAELNSQFLVKADLVLVWPPDREAVDGAPVLQWQSFPGAAQYHVLILNDEAYPPQVVVDRVVTATSFAVSPPLRAGHYTWTIQAQDASRGVVAELNSGFSVKAPLVLWEPADGANVGISPSLRWAPFEGAAQYQVLVVEADAYPPTVTLDMITGGTAVVVDPPLKPGTGYSLTIRALDTQGTALAESNTSFTVLAAGGHFDCATVAEMQPADCQALVTLYAETNGPAWANSADWLADDTPCDWSGVSCSDGHVTDLNLFYKEMTGALPAELADLAHLRVLALRDNRLTGPIPPALGQLDQLSYLDLSRNGLSGSLPAELSGLAELQFLYLYGNELSGPIPAALANLGTLRQLDLSDNALTGGIPPELGQMRSLESLRLARNQLSGSIPVELDQLTALTELDLSDNALSGPVPAPLLALPYRALWGNQLDGTVRCECAPPSQIDFAGLSFICFSSLGTSVYPEMMPAVPTSANGPAWVARPAHVRFTLAGAPGAAQHAPMGAAVSAQAQVLVYPTADYAALEVTLLERIEALRALLAAKPASIEGEVPLLPLNNAQQVLHAQVAYLDFENGRGVRYLTQYAQGVGPINNQELFYTFQGLTDDGAYYVAAFFPVALPALPASAEVNVDDYASFLASYDSYLMDTIVLLDEQPAEAYTPSLAQIDRLIESLVVHGE